MKRYWDDDGHRTEQYRIADRVWDVLDKYNTIEEDERGFPTHAACRDSESCQCDSGGTSNKEGTAENTASQA